MSSHLWAIDNGCTEFKRAGTRAEVVHFRIPEGLTESFVSEHCSVTTIMRVVKTMEQISYRGPGIFHLGSLKAG